MRKFLLLTIAAIFTFSCSEYGDDGSPNDIIITNPDGTKKIKKIHSEITSENTMNIPGMPADSAMSIVLNVVTDINYSADSYSFVGTTTQTMSMSGMAGMPGSEDMNQEITTTITSTVENNLLTEVRTTSQTPEGAITSKMVYSYNENRLSGINYYEGNILTATSTLVYNADNAVITRDYMDEELPTETITLNFDNFKITDGTLASDNSSNPINFELVRDSINVSQINLSSDSDQSTINYTYDNADNYKNNLTPEFNEARLNAEIVSLTGLGYSSQVNGASLDIFNAEAGLRVLAENGANNLIQVVNNGATVMSRTYVYDDENYAIGYTETVDISNAIDISGMFDNMHQMMIDQLVAAGMSVEEATAQADQMMAMFEEMDFSGTAQDVGTIEYYE